MLLDVDELKLRLRRRRIVPDRFCIFFTDIIFLVVHNCQNIDISLGSGKANTLAQFLHFSIRNVFLDGQVKGCKFLIKKNQHRTQCLKSSIWCGSIGTRIHYCYISQIFNFTISRTLIKNYKTFSINLFWSQMIKIDNKHIFYQAERAAGQARARSLGLSEMRLAD